MAWLVSVCAYKVDSNYTSLFKSELHFNTKFTFQAQASNEKKRFFKGLSDWIS